MNAVAWKVPMTAWLMVAQRDSRMVDDWELPQVVELASKWGILLTADLKSCQWGFEVWLRCWTVAWFNTW